MSAPPRHKPLAVPCLLLVGVAACSNTPATPDATVDADAGRCLRPLAIERVDDLGAFSLPSPAVLSRDGVSSGLLRGRLTWTFGDTFLTRRNTVDDSSVPSATAGWSRPEAPLALAEPVDDAGLPAQLIPYSDDELRANRADPLNGWALWPGAVIDTGAAEALVLFQRVRRMSGSGFASVAIGTARLAAGATRATRDTADLFRQEADAGAAAPSVLYGSGGVSVIDGFAYFFACSNVGFLNQGCRVGRAPTARAGDRAAFTFFDGSAWTADATRAAVVIERVGGGVSVTRNPHLGCYLAVSGALLRSAMTLRVSERLEGGWGTTQAGVPRAGHPLRRVPPDALPEQQRRLPDERVLRRALHLPRPLPAAALARGLPLGLHPRVARDVPVQRLRGLPAGDVPRLLPRLPLNHVQLGKWCFRNETQAGQGRAAKLY